MASLADLVALIGDRFAPGLAKQGWARPHATYFQVGRDGVNGLDGPSGIAGVRVQVSWVADRQAQAALVARLLRGTRGDQRLDGLTNTTAGGIAVRAVRLEDERELDLSPEGAAGTGPFEVQQDWALWFDEANSTV